MHRASFVKGRISCSWRRFIRCIRTNECAAAAALCSLLTRRCLCTVLRPQAPCACAGQETSPSIVALRVSIQSLDISPPHLQKIMLTSVWLLLFKSHCIRNSNDWQTTSNALGPTVSRVFAYLCLTTWRCQLQQQQQHLPVAQSLMKCICRTTGSRIHRDTLREEKTPCCSLIRVTLLRRKLLDRRRLRSWVSQGTAAES